MWKKIAGVAMTWCLSPLMFAIAPASADVSRQTAQNTTEIAAQIKGVLEGETREWFVLSHGNDSNASFVERGDGISIDITGFIDDEAWDAKEALSISLNISEGELISAAVIHPLGDSAAPPLYTSEGGEVSVTLTHFERTSQVVYVAGKVQGVLALQFQLGEPPSREEGIEVDVAFDVEAQKIEF